MQSEFSSEQDALAAIIVAIHRLGECSSDSPEISACLRWEASLSTAQTHSAEQLVKQLRDELQYYKSNFNDSFDQSEQILELRQQARDVAKKVVNYFVLRRRAAVAPTMKG
jgi:hypothetical protein